MKDTSKIIDELPASQLHVPLLFLWGRQTEAERGAENTIEQNGVGFNAADAGFAGSLVKWNNRGNAFSDKQAAALRKMLRKYKGQLSSIEKDLVKLVGKEGEKKVTPMKRRRAIKMVSFLGDKTGTNYLKITFPYDPNAVSQVRTLEGRRFNGEEKFWTCPTSLTNYEKLREWDFPFDDAVTAYFADMVSAAPAEQQDTISVPGLDATLYDFQKQGASFLEAKNGRAIIADEMGLGKTLQALCYLAIHPRKKPIIIICPGHLKLNWLKEIRMWMKRKKDHVYLINGGVKARSKEEYKDHLAMKSKNKNPGCIIIINYDLLADRKRTLSIKEGEFNCSCGHPIEVKPSDKKIKCSYCGQKWDIYCADSKWKASSTVKGWRTYLPKAEVLITDECHYYKSAKAYRTKAVKKLAAGVPHVLAISGTPIVNRPIEFYNAINLVAPGLFSSRWAFAMRYCGARHNGFGWDFNGSSNTQELHDILTGTVMIRRLKKDVLKDLPPKVRTVLPVEITNRAEYDHAEADFLVWIKEVKGAAAAQKAATAETLARIEHLKQLSIKGKMDSVIKWIRDFLDSGEKLVVFATHHKTIDTIMEAFPKESVKCDGRDSQAKREKAVEGFQNKKGVRLFVGNIKAAGTGITLTEASNTCFVELGWSPGEHDQAEDRVHRIGQTDSVTAWYLLAAKTIEEEIIALIDKKRKVLDQVLDGKETEEVHLLTELLSRMTEGETK